MPQRWAPHYANLNHEYTAWPKDLEDLVQFLLVDDADRLTAVSLAQLRDLFDRGDVARVLIGLPGSERSSASETSTNSVR